MSFVKDKPDFILMTLVLIILYVGVFYHTKYSKVYKYKIHTEEIDIIYKTDTFLIYNNCVYFYNKNHDFTILCGNITIKNNY